MSNAAVDTHVRLVCPHLKMTDGQPSLMGNRCTNCNEVYFPPGSGCTRCRSTAMEPFEIGSEGVLWSWTIQGFLPKPPYNSGETELDFQPYGVGYVQMPSGIKIESRLSVSDAARLHIGMRMRLALAPYGATPEGERLYTFVFTPLDGETERNTHA